MPRHAVCFVDDDAEELRRFEETFSDRFDIGTGHSPNDALEDLGRQKNRRPDLFLLDMYIPDGPLPTDEQLQKLHQAREEFLKAQSEFRSFLAEIGQTAEGGLKIARQLRRTSKIGYSFFTRKGTVEDAITAYEEVGAVSVIKKPDPDPADVAQLEFHAAYDRALRNAADSVASQIERAIGRSSWWARHGSTVIGFALGVLVSLVVAGIYGIALFLLATTAR